MRGFDRDRGGRDPARAFVEETRRVSVGKDIRPYPGAFKLQKDRMLTDDRAHGFVGKSLLMIAEQGGCVHAGQDRRLTRRALRSAFDAEPRVSPHEHAVVWQLRFFIREDSERRSLCAEPVERIVRAACADP